MGSDFEPGDGEDDGEYEIDLFEEGDVVGSDFLENVSRGHDATN